MKCHIILLVLFLLTVSPLYSVAAQQRPKRETWYERALRHINPNDTNYGEIFEQRKREFISRIGSPMFEYCFWTTVSIVLLLAFLYIHHVTHRRALVVIAQSMTDVLRHDAYSREVAREAIRRHNAHIESCNRMIEAEESGTSKWISFAELEVLQSNVEKYRSEAADLREETNRLREEDVRQRTGATGATAQSSSDSQATIPFAKDSAVTQYITLINELQQELLAERKKNQRLKSTTV
jgi:hypothetical protein